MYSGCFYLLSSYRRLKASISPIQIIIIPIENPKITPRIVVDIGLERSCGRMKKVQTIPMNVKRKPSNASRATAKVRLLLQRLHFIDMLVEIFPSLLTTLEYIYTPPSAGTSYPPPPFIVIFSIRFWSPRWTSSS